MAYFALSPFFLTGLSFSAIDLCSDSLIRLRATRLTSRFDLWLSFNVQFHLVSQLPFVARKSLSLQLFFRKWFLPLSSSSFQPSWHESSVINGVTLPRFCAYSWVRRCCSFRSNFFFLATLLSIVSYASWLHQTDNLHVSITRTLKTSGIFYGLIFSDFTTCVSITSISHCILFVELKLQIFVRLCVWIF